MKQEFNRAMERLSLPPEAERRIVTALEERRQTPALRPKKTWKTAVAAVAAAALMTGTAFAAAYRKPC